MNELLKAALWYLDRMKWYVIPINMHTKAAFIPYAHFNDDPDKARESITEDQLRQWWTEFPDAGIGCLLIPSGLTVIDYDTYNPKYAKDEIREKVPYDETTAFQITPHKGFHFFYQRAPELIHKPGVFPGLDIRNSSYIPLSPSQNDAGKYQWSVPTLDWIKKYETLNINSLDLSIRKNLLYKRENSDSLQKSPKVSKSLKLFKQGTRDDDLFHIANCLIKGKAEEEIVKQTIEILARNCDPPFPEREISAKIQSALQRATRREINIALEVRKFIEVSTGLFQVSDVLQESQEVSKNERHAIILELARLCKAGVIEKYGDKRGSYRIADKECEEIDFAGVDENDTLGVQWPLGIENYFRTFPKNIIVVAGESDSGKTAFLLNFASLNMDNHKINYFSSEMGAMELRDRLVKFDMPFDDWQKVSFKERAGNFADVIKPDEINIVDFLEMHEDFFKVGGFIKAIFDRLKTGIAVIALQKPRGRDEGVGGEKSVEKARLYLSMSPGLIKIRKAKNWVNSQLNPNGLRRKFKLVQGCNFIPTTTWELEIDEKYKDFIA